MPLPDLPGEEGNDEMMIDMNKARRRRDQIVEEGVAAERRGEPNESPYRAGVRRALWEMGWRWSRREREERNEERKKLTTTKRSR